MSLLPIKKKRGLYFLARACLESMQLILNAAGWIQRSPVLIWLRRSKSTVRLLIIFFLEFRWGKVNTQANGHPVLHPASQTCPWHSPWDQLRLHRPWLVRASEVWGALGNGRWGPRVLCYSRCESRTNVPAFPGSLWKMQTLLPHLGHFVPESAFYQDPQWFLYTLWFEKHWYRMLLCSICS